jgi:hypothetical protein
VLRFTSKRHTFRRSGFSSFLLIDTRWIEKSCGAYLCTRLCVTTKWLVQPSHKSCVGCRRAFSHSTTVRPWHTLRWQVAAKRRRKHLHRKIQIIPPAAGTWFAPRHSGVVQRATNGIGVRAVCLDSVPLFDFERPGVAHNRQRGAGVLALQGRASRRFRLE